MPLTQTQLATAVAERAEITGVEAKRVLGALEEIVLEELSNTQKVRVGGLVQLTVRVKPAQTKRKGRNPATGEEITIAASPRASTFVRDQQVMLSEDERRRLRDRAAELGVSVPRLLVESALAGVETPSDRREMIAELFEVRRLLATVANNVNQLAKAANISGEIGSRERVEATFADVDEILVGLRGWTGVRR